MNDEGEPKCAHDDDPGACPRCESEAYWADGGEHDRLRAIERAAKALIGDGRKRFNDDGDVLVDEAEWKALRALIDTEEWAEVNDE